MRLPTAPAVETVLKHLRRGINWPKLGPEEHIDLTVQVAADEDAYVLRAMRWDASRPFGGDARTARVLVTAEELRRADLRGNGALIELLRGSLTTLATVLRGGKPKAWRLFNRRPAK